MRQALMQRNQTFDMLRLVAIFGVVFLHQKFDAVSGLDASSILRLMMRWSVPFFFMLTGFFLSSYLGFAEISISRVRRIGVITIIANLLFLPLAIAMNGLGTLTISTLVLGTWFHLWFLNALILSLILLVVLPSLARRPSVISALSVLIFLAYYLADTQAMLDPNPDYQLNTVMRQFSGLAFVWFGFSIAQLERKSFRPRFAAILIAGGVLLVVAEAMLWSSLGYSVVYRQLPLGAISMTFGFLILGMSLQKKDIPGAEIGRDQSLSVYIIHPIFLKIAGIFLSTLGIVGSSASYLAIAFGFVASVSFCMALDKIWPSAANILRGQLPELHPAPKERQGLNQA
ncbi:MAG: acyltransferase family protein [Marinibacterium profundimaris]